MKPSRVDYPYNPVQGDGGRHQGEEEIESCHDLLADKDKSVKPRNMTSSRDLLAGWLGRLNGRETTKFAIFPLTRLLQRQCQLSRDIRSSASANCMAPQQMQTAYLPGMAMGHGS